VLPANRQPISLSKKEMVYAIGPRYGNNNNNNLLKKELPAKIIKNRVKQKADTNIVTFLSLCAYFLVRL
jgi:hypothetical protein